MNPENRQQIGTKFLWCAEELRDSGCGNSPRSKRTLLSIVNLPPRVAFRRLGERTVYVARTLGFQSSLQWLSSCLFDENHWERAKGNCISYGKYFIQRKTKKNPKVRSSPPVRKRNEKSRRFWFGGFTGIFLTQKKTPLIHQIIF